MQSLLDGFTVLQPVVVTLAALIGVVIAGMGLQTWRQQLKGRTEYDLARRFLRATFRLRDEIHSLRSPLMLAGEIQVAAEEAGIDLSSEGQTHKAVAAARARRWQRVQQASSELRIEEIEAEVLWGRDIASCTAAVHAEIRAVWAAEMEHHDRTQPDGADDENRQRLPALRRVMYGSGSDGDETANAISRAVKSVESTIRPKLKP